MENNLCKVIDLWHEPFNLPKADHGLEIPCLVFRKKSPVSHETEIISDVFMVKTQSFTNSPMDMVVRWCYIDDIKPCPYSKHWMDLYEIKETFFQSTYNDDPLSNYHFFYTQIEIKDDFSDVFEEMDKDSTDYKCLYKSFDEEYDHPDIMRYVVPTENGNDFLFETSLTLFVIRYFNNGRTLLAAKERMLLELAVAKVSNPVFLKVSYGE